MKVYSAFLIVCCLACLILGMMLGAIFYHKLLIVGAVQIAEGLEGTTFNLNVDLNETEITDRVMFHFNVTGFLDDARYNKTYHNLTQ